MFTKRLTKFASRASVPYYSSSRAFSILKDVPVIDCHEFENPEATSPLIIDACSQWGFFQIINHGLDETLKQNMLKTSREFFALPLEEKLKVKRTENNSRGFFHDELTKQKLDNKQGFDYGAVPRPDLPHDHPEQACMDGFNFWPQNPPEFQPALWTYFDAVTEVARHIAEVMAIGLGEQRNFFDGHFNNHSSFCRVNYYPKSNEEQAKSLGVHPHKDAGFLTVLYQDDVASLQVCKDDQWYTIQPVEGAFVINVGDMAQVWSNDRYPAPLHRVLSSTKEERISVPFFYNPNYSSMVEPLQSLVTEDTPAMYDPISWATFRSQRFAGDYADQGEEIQIEHFLRVPK